MGGWMDGFFKREHAVLWTQPLSASLLHRYYKLRYFLCPAVFLRYYFLFGVFSSLACPRLKRMHSSIPSQAKTYGRCNFETLMCSPLWQQNIKSGVCFLVLKPSLSFWNTVTENHRQGAFTDNSSSFLTVMDAVNSQIRDARRGSTISS